MWGVTAWAVTSTGTSQAALTSILDWPGRQLQPGVDHDAPVHDLLDRLLGEVETDLAAIGFGLALRDDSGPER